MSDLKSFADAWLLNPVFKVPVNCIDISTGLHGLVLYSDNVYQVQLFIAAPNHCSTNHNHPNCDAIQVNMGGKQIFSICGVAIKNSGVFDSCPIPSGIDHSVIFGDTGGAYLSIQHWPGEKKSIRNDWVDDVNGHPGITPCVFDLYDQLESTAIDLKEFIS